VVGLPYPSVKSAELREKMDYLNSHMVCMIRYRKISGYLFTN